MSLLKPFETDFSGINLVEASAGTGKTYNIMSLYIRAIVELEISVKKILVVTYTEAATKELKDGLLRRIRQSITVLKEGELKEEEQSDLFLNNLLEQVANRQKAVEKLEQAVRMFDEASIYTIHGFCYQVLQEQAFESRAMYEAEMIGEDNELVQEAVDDYWRNWIDEASRNSNKHSLIKLMSDNGMEPESLAREMGPYIGKPYLHVLPDDIGEKDINAQLQRFQKLHYAMKEVWDQHQSDLLELLSGDEMSNYRSDWLSGWFNKMNIIFKAGTPTVDIFDQFDRFTQSRIDDSLTKAALKRGAAPPQHSFFKLADEYQQIAQSLSNYDVIFRKQLLEYLRFELNQKKEELQVLSYDDLLLRLRNALMEEKHGKILAKKIREKYPITMVDEFQDTDPNQYDIFRQIYKDYDDYTLFMIGDPKQSIYSFRGADVYSYIKARKDVAKDKRFKLNRNFRSTPKLLYGLNAFWGSHDNPFVIKGDIEYKKVNPGWDRENYDIILEYEEERPAIRFRQLSKPGQDQHKKGAARVKAVNDTVQEIVRLLEGGKKHKITIGGKPVKAKDIAVLVRKHKQADLISDALQKHGIKSVRHSNQSVFESNEAKQLTQFLKAVAEPANETLVKTALSLPLSGYTAKMLLKIEEDEQNWIQILDQFADWHKQWQNQGFAAMFGSMIAEFNIAQSLITYADGERRLTNLLHLGELLQKESKTQKTNIRSLLHWLKRKSLETTNSERDEEQMRLESDEELVKIVTMHKCKGLQYPIVFCPFLWQGPDIKEKGNPLVYHHPNDNETTFLDLKGKKDPDRAEKRFYVQRESLAESMRLAYVAMTRAMHCLYLTWVYATDSELSSLGYMLQDSQKAQELLRTKLSDQKYNKPDGSEMFDAIDRLCTKYPNLFTQAVDMKKSGSQLDLLDSEENLVLEAAEFKRTTPLRNSYKVSSFSSLTSWMDDDPDTPDYDQFLYVSDNDSSQALEGIEKEQNMFTFPKGPQPGTAIHNIFENIEFSDLDNSDEIIREQLLAYGIDQKWVGTVKNMLDIVLDKSLLPDNDKLTLSVLSPTDMIAEMEFYYKNDAIETNDVISIIRKGEDIHNNRGGRADHGFLKGFIDLTFRYDNKFYLLDYKTNYLGDSIANYEQRHLTEEMFEASYDLQYHIYTIALHRFLKRKLPGYTYEKNFGGAFYLFLRGINRKGREGIFHDRPSENTIRKLDQYIWEGGYHE